MRTILQVIDSISEWMGRTGRWFAVALVATMTFEVTSRYIFGRPNLWVHESVMMLGASLYALAYGYVQRHDAHIRADLFYARLSPRRRAIIDVAGWLLIFFPLIILLIDTSIFWAVRAWRTGEVMPFTGWYPPVAPLRTVVALGFCVLALQGVAQLIRDLHLLIRNKPYD
ncbi:TRAP transporter small permease subunit [Dehalococcoidia bacterium]|nr:TRAP transporter small permease subunit [Dehalococcoidia bacterium]